MKGPPTVSRFRTSCPWKFSSYRLRSTFGDWSFLKCIMKPHDIDHIRSLLEKFWEITHLLTLINLPSDHMYRDTGSPNSTRQKKLAQGNTCSLSNVIFSYLERKLSKLLSKRARLISTQQEQSYDRCMGHKTFLMLRQTELLNCTSDRNWKNFQQPTHRYSPISALYDYDSSKQWVRYDRQ